MQCYVIMSVLVKILSTYRENYQYVSKRTKYIKQLVFNRSAQTQFFACNDIFMSLNLNTLEVVSGLARR